MSMSVCVCVCFTDDRQFILQVSHVSETESKKNCITQSCVEKRCKILHRKELGMLVLIDGTCNAIP